MEYTYTTSGRYKSWKGVYAQKGYTRTFRHNKTAIKLVIRIDGEEGGGDGEVFLSLRMTISRCLRWEEEWDLRWVRERGGILAGRSRRFSWRFTETGAGVRGFRCTRSQYPSDPTEDVR